MNSLQPKLFAWFLVGTLVGPALSYGKVYLFHLMVVALGIFALKSPKTLIADIKNYFSEKSLRLFHLHLFCSLICGLWASYYSYQYAVFCLFQLAIFYFIFQGISDKEKMHHALKIGFWVVIVNTLICYLEFLTPFRYPISSLSPLATYFGKNSASYLNWQEFLVINPTNEMHPTGLFWSINSVPAFCIMALPFTLFVAKKPWDKIIGALLAILIFYSTFRLGQLVLVLFAICYLLFETINLKTLKEQKLKLLAIVLVCSLSMFNTFTREKVRTAMNLCHSIIQKVQDLDLKVNEASLKKDSVSIRLNRAKIAINKIIDKPIQGNGLGAANKDNFLHFFWLENLVDLGLLMGSFFIAWYFFLAYQLFQRRKASPMAKAAFYSLLLYCPAVLAHSNANYFLPFWLLLAIAAKINQLERPC